MAKHPNKYPNKFIKNDQTPEQVHNYNMKKDMRDGWTYKKLGEVCSINSGKSIKSNLICADKFEGGFPCYGGNGLRGYVSCNSHEGGLPVIGRVGALCGNVHYVQQPFYATEHALVVSKISEDVDHAWLCRLLESMKLGDYAEGVAQPVIAASKITKLCIPLPPLTTQQQIVSELDLLTHILDQKRQQLKEYDALAESIFYDMFGDPVENPKGWEVKKLRAVSKFFNGKAHENSIDEDGAFILVNAKFIASSGSIVKRTNIQLFPLVKNDIVMVMSDVPNGKALARCYLVEEDNKYTLNQRICAFRGYTENSIYMLWLLNRNEYFLSFNDGNGQTNLRKEEVLDCPLPLPPLPLQQTFAAKIQSIEHQKQLLKESIKETEMLFQSRMDYWFNG